MITEMKMPQRSRISCIKYFRVHSLNWRRAVMSWHYDVTISQGFVYHSTQKRWAKMSSNRTSQPGDLDLWPWPSNLSKILSRCIPLPNFVPVCQTIQRWVLIHGQKGGRKNGTDSITSTADARGNSVICLLKAHPLIKALPTVWMTYSNQHWLNGSNSPNNLLIFNPKPPLENPEPQLLLHDILFKIAIAPCAFITINQFLTMDKPIPLYPYTMLARSFEAAATEILSLFRNSYILEEKYLFMESASIS